MTTTNNTDGTNETQVTENQSTGQTEKTEDTTGSASSEVQSKTEENSTDSSDDPFASRTRESLVDEVKSLRAENKSKREAVKASEESTEDVIKALRTEIATMRSEVRREKIAGMGVPADKLDLLMKIEDEDTAISLAEALAETKTPRSTDLNAQKGFSTSNAGLTLEQQARQDFLDGLNKAQ